MTAQEFIRELDARIGNYDLLCHPFYQAWNDGTLSRDDLREYAKDYYHHVKAFPTYLAELGIRLDEGDLRRAVLANMMDEVGKDAGLEEQSVPHSELWLDFVEGMGARRDLLGHKPAPEIAELTKLFHSLASEGTPAEALAAFYAYESQVPRLAKIKASGLRERYGATKGTYAYFTLHETADVHHANVWRRQLEKLVERNPAAANKALAAAEKAAQALWRALDGIEARRMAMAA